MESIERNNSLAALTGKFHRPRSEQYGFENTSIYFQREHRQHPVRANVKYAIKRLLNRIKIQRRFADDFARLMTNLDQPSSNLLIELLAYRMKGFRHVKLSINTPEYWNQIGKLEAMAKTTTSDSVKAFNGLKRFELKELGYDIAIDYTVEGIMMDYVLEQYACKGANPIEVSDGDTVLDLGGCWGDTALYFAHKVGASGHVYSFEFIPRNIGVFHANVNLNPHLKSRVSLVDAPVYSSSKLPVYFQDKGAGSKVSMRPFKEMTGNTKTLSVDDFVREMGIKVNFIKMDIEGAEMSALEGARETIVKFKPKLAIAIYHSIEDMARIPNWILDLDLGYKLQLRHNTIYEDETVCFASV